MLEDLQNFLHCHEQTQHHWRFAAWSSRNPWVFLILRHVALDSRKTYLACSSWSPLTLWLNQSKCWTLVDMRNKTWIYKMSKFALLESSHWEVLITFVDLWHRGGRELSKLWILESSHASCQSHWRRGTNHIGARSATSNHIGAIVLWHVVKNQKIISAPLFLGMLQKFKIATTSNKRKEKSNPFKSVLSEKKSQKSLLTIKKSKQSHHRRLQIWNRKNGYCVLHWSSAL